MAAKTHTPISVANYLLKKDKAEKGGGLDQLKLTKLVYLCHGWSLGILSQPLVNESPEAWKQGPAFPSLVEEIKLFGESAVKPPLGDGNLPKFSGEQKELVDAVYDEYHQIDGVQLMWMSHQVGAPWRTTWVENPYKYAPIDDKRIKRYYEELLHA